MADPRLGVGAFRLLEAFAAEPTRDWYHDNKAQLDTELRAPVAAVLEAVSLRLADAALPLSGGARTMFRQARDVRFSKDKTPYKTHIAGLLTASGAKDETGGLVYVHLDPTGGFTAGGFYRLTPAALGPLRDRIRDAPEQFDAVLTALAAAGTALQTENSLKSMPRGYAGAVDHRHAWALRLKSFVAQRPLTRADWESGAVVETVAALARACTPLLRLAG